MPTPEPAPFADAAWIEPREHDPDLLQREWQAHLDAGRLSPRADRSPEIAANRARSERLLGIGRRRWVR